MYSSQQYLYGQQQQPQYSAYQQPSYPPPPPQYTYPPQPPYAPPPPPNPHVMSAPEFRAWFLGKLSELVVNQKTIIHNLAFIANDNVHRMGHVVAECIETHIRMAHPQVKLPAWYLLDSIAKNIGPPYTQFFASSVARLFLDSYHAVDVSTRSKMEEMLVTWRTGGRGATELFGSEIQSTIENGVWSVPVSRRRRWAPYPRRTKSGSPTPAFQSASSPSTLSRQSGPSKAQVLTELEVILAQKMRAVELTPYDTQSAGHIESLTQLRTLVQTSAVSKEELQAIATQLRTLARSTASAAPPLSPMVPPPQPVFAPQPPAAQVPYSAYPAAYSSVSAAAPVPTAAPVNVSSASAISSIPAAADISALFQTLIKAGVVPGSSARPTPATAASTSSTLASLSSLSHLLKSGALAVKSEPESTLPATDPQAEAEKEYERAILRLDIPLTASGIQREQPQAISFLYDHLALQCKQCGQRFPDGGGKNQKRYEDHIDVHARQNMKNATAAASTSGVGTMGRGYTRSWFVGKQDWVHDVTRDVSLEGNLSSSDKGKGRADSPSSSGKVSNHDRDAKLQASYVVIPAGDEAKSLKCPICKEVFQTEFLEDEEEWVWRNAASFKGKVYHATCHADAVAAHLARRRQEGVATGTSRSSTPDFVKHEDMDVKPHKSSLHPSPLAGLKRKAEDSDPDSRSRSRSTSAAGLAGDHPATGVPIKQEETDSPRPMKKLALAPA